MKLPTYIRFTKHEMAFLLMTFAVLIVGTVISIQVRQPDWMPGVGAAMIVLGVVFAVFDLRNILASKADQFYVLRKELIIRSKIDDYEDETHTTPSEEEGRRIRHEAERDITRRLPSQGPTIRKRLHLVEVFIVCLGTLVNGFGQKILEWYLC